VYTSQTILGQVPSKSNCYRVITLHGHGALGKTKALQDYEETFFLQCSLRGAMISKRFSLTVDVYYKSDLPDLDNALKTILDCLQTCKVIKNDRLCAEIKARKLIDKTNPRIEFTISELL
jgi:Holliday junction resolvase RusA-like endonuclease